ncbi:MAG: hypothetical protein P4L87_21595, partial [Formivibrio sp.]|nr:hypothetical protein [Formivibrio sp.]
GTIDQSSVSKQRKLPLHAPHTRLDLTGNLSNKKRFIRCAIEKRQHPTPGLPEEQVADGCKDRSHFKNNCTQNKNNLPSGDVFGCAIASQTMGRISEKSCKIPAKKQAVQFWHTTAKNAL